MVNTPIFANWVQIEITKIFEKSMQINHKNFNILIMTFFSFYVVETFSKIDFLFQNLHSSRF